MVFLTHHVCDMPCQGVKLHALLQVTRKGVSLLG
jgi:hypothetical protein